MRALKADVSYRLLRWLDPPRLILHLHPDSEWAIEGFWGEVFDMMFRLGMDPQTIYEANSDCLPVDLARFQELTNDFLRQLDELGVLEGPDGAHNR